MPTGRRRGAKLLELGIGCALALLLLEAWVRIAPPFEIRMKGDNIVLPVNTEIVVRNDGHSPKLDSRIVLRRNSLGFRGAEPPEAFDDHITLVTVGGSTTECSFLTEGKTWPDRVGQQLEQSFAGVWLNNAGIDGHSTFGHLALLRGHLTDLSPDVAIFLIGNNDRGRGAPSLKDLGQHSEGLDWTSFSGFAKSVSHYSDAVALAIALLRYKRAVDLGLVYRGQIDVEQIPKASAPPPEEHDRLEAMHRETQIPHFRNRLLEIVELSRSHGIEPVFVTQPGLYGPAVDAVTGVDLATIERNGINGATAWEILELYNETTREVGALEDVLVVDLARALPKSSLFFYDLVHFTNEGAVEIGRIMHEALCPFLAERFPTHQTTDCPGGTTPPTG